MPKMFLISAQRLLLLGAMTRSMQPIKVTLPQIPDAYLVTALPLLEVKCDAACCLAHRRRSVEMSLDTARTSARASVKSARKKV